MATSAAMNIGGLPATVSVMSLSVQEVWQTQA
jgi:hypothetical protein